MSVSPELVRKLYALRKRVHESLEPIQLSRGREIDRNNYDPEIALEWFARWAAIRTDLSSDPEFRDVPARPAPVPQRTIDFDGRGVIKRNAIERLRDDIEDVWDVLDHPSRTTPQFSLDREGVFVAGQAFDAMLAISSIIRSAKAKIVMVDGYVTEKNLDLLSAKDTSATVEIYTLARSATPAFIRHAQAWATQYGSISVRTGNHFHDRFVIIDDADYYHFGASIKDAAKHTFMFSRVEEPSMISALKADFAAAWAAGVVVI